MRPNSRNQLVSARHHLRVSQGRHRDARLRLKYELLEQRYMLAGDFDETLQPSESVNWFAADSAITRVPLAQLAAVDRPLGVGVAGPRELASGEWIVKLNAQASGSVSQLFESNRLLSDGTNEFLVIRGLGEEGLLLVQAKGPSRLDIETSLLLNPNVLYHSLNELIEGQLEPDDTEFSNMVGLNNEGQFDAKPDADINAPQAWDLTTGSATVVVGVIDSGIDAMHPDLYQNVWLNQGEIPVSKRATLIDVDNDGLITFYDLNVAANSSEVRDRNNSGYIDALDLLDDPLWADGLDTDGNGFNDDFYGWNFRTGSGEIQNNPRDVLGHGTHVSGTIGAVGNNDQGVTGINWQSSIMALKFLDENNQGDTGAAIAAINYATMMRTKHRVNVTVTNNSWGQSGGENESLKKAIADSGEAGILFVAASGNGNVLGQGFDIDRAPFYPASYDLDNIIAVGASDTLDKVARFSNFGPKSVDIVAPGVGILSTLPGEFIDGQYVGRYGTANGTSMAAPHVAGTAALIQARLPGATLGEVRAAIINSAETHKIAINQVSSNGRLDAFAALQDDGFAPRSSLLPTALIEPFNEADAESPYMKDEPNDTIETAQNVDSGPWNQNFRPDIIDSSFQPHLSITVTGDGSVDFYQFTVSNPGDFAFFDIDGVSDADFDPTLTLLQSDGTLLFTSFDQFSIDEGSTRLSDPLIYYSFTNPGIYQLRVTSGPFGEPVPSGASYKLHISISNHPLAPADVLENLFPGQGLAGTFANIDSVTTAPWNRFNDATITESTSLPHLSIRGTGDDTADVYEFSVASPNTRGVFDIDNSFFDATPLEFTNEFNTSIELAQDLDLARWSLNDNFSEVEDPSIPFSSVFKNGFEEKYYYKFTVDNPNSRAIFDIDQTFGTFDATLRLYATDGTLLATGFDNSNLDPFSFEFSDPYLEYVFADPGVYVIEVSSGAFFEGIFGQYILRTSVEGHSFTPAFNPTLTLHGADGTILATSFDQPLDVQGNPIIDPGSFVGTDPLIDFTFSDAGNYYITVTSTEQFQPIPRGAGYTLHASIAGHATDASILQNVVSTVTSNQLELTVVYRDLRMIDISTIDNKDISITRSATGETFSPVSTSMNASDPNAVAVTYFVAAPGGFWDPLDFGDYVVTLNRNEVRNQTEPIGVAAVGRVLGTFQVRIADGSSVIVSTTDDTPDANLLDGQPRDSSGEISLRAAIQNANRSTLPSFIFLEKGVYKLTIDKVTDGSPDGASGDLDILQDITIVGTGPGTIIDAAGLDRVFDVHAGARFTLIDATIQGGNADLGGGIRVIERSTQQFPVVANPIYAFDFFSTVENALNIDDAQNWDSQQNFQVLNSETIPHTTIYTDSFFGDTRFFEFDVATDGAQAFFDIDSFHQSTTGEFEPNDDFSIAQDIDFERFSNAMDSAITDSTTLPHITIYGGGDETLDLFKFTVPSAGARGVFDIDYTYAAVDAVDMTLTLYSENGAVLFTNLDRSSGDGVDAGSVSLSDAFLDIVFPAAGTYFIEVSSGPNSDVVPFSHQYALHVSIEGHAQQTVFNELTLLDGNGIELASTDGTNNGVVFDPDDPNVAFLAYTFPIAGTYYIELDSNASFVSLNVSVEGHPINTISVDVGEGFADLSRVQIRENIANQGGGIANSGTLVVSNSVIAGNTSVLRGGGVAILAGGVATIDETTIDQNLAIDHFAAAVYSEGQLTIDRSTISHHNDLQANTTIEIDSADNGSGSAMIRRSTISGNSGIQLLKVLGAGMVDLTNVTIVDNNVGDAVVVDGNPLSIGADTVFFDIEPNDTPQTSQDINDAQFWSLDDHPSILDSTLIPHTTIVGDTGDLTVDAFSFTVANSGDLGIFDIDDLVIQDFFDAEPNDSIATAQSLDTTSWSRIHSFEISDSELLPHITVIGSGDNTVDFYQFNIENPLTQAIFDIDGTFGTFDATLDLYTADGNIIASSFDQGDDPGSFDVTDPFLSHFFDEPGTYYLGVTAGAGFAAIPEFATYQLHVSVDSKPTPSLTVIDPDGDVLATSSNPFFFGFPDFEDPFSPNLNVLFPVSGTYTVLYNGPRTSYVLHTSIENHAIRLAPASVAISNSLIAGNNGSDVTLLSGSLFSGGRNLLSTLGAGPTGIESTIFSSKSLDVIQNNASQFVGPLADNGGPTLTHSLLAGSAAIDRGPAIGGLIVESEPNNGNSLADAQSLENPPEWIRLVDFDPNVPLGGQVAHVTIHGGGDGTFDYYSFSNTVPNSRYIFDIDVDRDNSSLYDTEIFLFDEFGNLLGTNDIAPFPDPGSSSSYESYLEQVLPVGNFILGVGRYPSDASSTAWQIGFIPEVTDSEFIPNLSIFGIGDGTVEYYRFDATAGARGVLDIDYPFSGDDSFNPTLTLYDPFGNELVTSTGQSEIDPGSFSLDEPFIDFIFPTSGSYFVAVSGGPNLSPVNIDSSFVLNFSVEGHTAVPGIGFFNPSFVNVLNDSIASAYDLEDSGGISGSPLMFGDNYTLHIVGENHPSASGFVSDQRGISVQADGDGDGLPSSDVGAFERSQGSIEGFVYFDRDSDRARDLSEPGLAGRTLFIDRNQNGVFDEGEPTTVSESDDPATAHVVESGHYRFDNVDAGTVVIGQQLPDNFVATELGSGAIERVSLTPMENVPSGVESAFDSFGPSLSGDGRFVVYGQYTDSTNSAVQYLLNDRQRNVTEVIPMPLLDAVNAGSVGFLEVEPNDALATPQNIDLAPWSLSFNANITESTTIPHLTIIGTGDDTFDYFEFNVAEAGSRGIFDIDEVSNFGQTFDTELFLFDEFGNLLAGNDDQHDGGLGSSSGVDSYIDYTFAAPGTYVVAVAKFNSFGEFGTVTGAAPGFGDGYTLHVSIAGHVTADATGTLDAPSISDDGNLIAFVSTDSSGSGFSNVFLYDRTRDEISRVSNRLFGFVDDGHSSDPQISADGKFVVFTSSNSQLTADDFNGVLPDVFAYEVATGTIQKVPDLVGSATERPTISGNGRWVVMTSVADPTDGTSRIIVWDRMTSAVNDIAIATDSTPDISDNGQTIVFRSLVPGSNGENSRSELLKYDRFSDVVEPLAVQGERI